MSTDIKIGFIGAGKMGGIILRGVLEYLKTIEKNKQDACSTIHYNKFTEKIFAFDIDSQKIAAYVKEFGITNVENFDVLLKNSDVIFLCIKPDQFFELAKENKIRIESEKTLVSIMAGVSIDTIKKHLGNSLPVIRVMPNIACSVNAGISAIIKSEEVREDIYDFAFNTFDFLGEAIKIPEDKINAVTALSGSGPAYIFVFMEAIIDAGVLMGLTYDTAKRLALMTLYGSSKLAIESQTHLSSLKYEVSSPAGTTIAGTSILEKKGFRGIIIKALETAYKRAGELGK